ncbi:hypothetical protein CK203_096477 [Vitis vinifera]|uniref:Uncharacterized protein n=1 Tax=Vitis vinifera TaxID=29760 RepID=A0A438DGG1_VITVI|nr:hypothetical protein CK203_096477 [Vitis vinifera]
MSMQEKPSTTKMSSLAKNQHHRENFIKEDKDRDSYFIDPFLIDPLKVSSPILVPSFSELKLTPIEPIFEPESSPIKTAPKNRMTGKVYSRKKATFPQLIQVQGSEPTFGNEEGNKEMY